MSYIVVDVEADGQIPHKFSMVSFGAIILEPGLNRTFYGQTKPISENWIPEALAISGFTRTEHEQFDDPTKVMIRFGKWINENSTGNHIFISDNPAFDWQWINYYFHFFTDNNPFGHSARRVGDLYCGMKMNTKLNREWKKKLTKTKHDHHPVNDAKGVAEALLEMEKMGLKF